jgi:hypothetical protein
MTATGKLDKALVTSIQEKLEEPFDPELLYWKPQAMNKEKTRAMVAVYADPRAYVDRLNEAVGVDGWSDQVEIVSTPTKIIAIVTVHVNGLNSAHTDVGESDLTDQNAATVAIAQGFKRACVKFGLGRYLYNFPKGQWCEYDQKTKQVKTPPTIPDWAIPKKQCEDCKERISSYSFSSKGESRTLSVSEIVQNSKKKYDKELCAECQRKRAAEGKKAAGDRLTPEEKSNEVQS